MFCGGQRGPGGGCSSSRRPCVCGVRARRAASARSQDSEFTVLVPAGRAECFFQAAVKNGTMEVEYQVTVWMDMGGLQSRPPSSRRSDGVHVGGAYGGGRLRNLLDNSFSRFSEKMVFFEIIIEGQGETWRRRRGASHLPPVEDHGLGFGGINTRCITSFISTRLILRSRHVSSQESMDSLHKRLERSRQMQTVLRAYEARDRNLLEDNLWRVSFWSCASVLVMLCVALTQVYTVRKLFDDKRRVCT
uniref:Transmembrane p24 trafficking protein 1b n=1 Tax=Salarias fasciatus TaxID=181472 RepID=A0A672I0U3_SALFA